MEDATVLTPEEERILEHYFRAEYVNMIRFASYALNDKNLAEVAVQDAFVVAARKINDMRNSQNPEGWLYNVLKNTIRQIRRDRKRILEHCISWDDIQEPAVEMDITETIDISKNEELKLLKRLYVDGYKLSEIAEELAINVPALKMRVSRAKKRLKNDPYIKKFKSSR